MYDATSNSYDLTRLNNRGRVLSLKRVARVWRFCLAALLLSATRLKYLSVLRQSSWRLLESQVAGVPLSQVREQSPFPLSLLLQ